MDNYMDSQMQIKFEEDFSEVLGCGVIKSRFQINLRHIRSMQRLSTST